MPINKQEETVMATPSALSVAPNLAADPNSGTALILPAFAAAYPVFKVCDIFGHWLAGFLGLQRAKEKEHEKKLDDHKTAFEGSLSALRQHVDGVHRTTADHFGVIENRVAENHLEFVEFKAEIAKEIATKDELNRAVDTITSTMKTHVDTILARLPRSR